MRSLTKFLKTTIVGGLFFFLPLVFIIIIIEKASVKLGKIIKPVAAKLQIDHFAGKATLTILVIIVLLLICFLGGLLMRVGIFKKISDSLNNFMIEFLPQFKQFRSSSEKKLADKTEKTQGDTGTGS